MKKVFYFLMALFPALIFTPIASATSTSLIDTSGLEQMTTETAEKGGIVSGVTVGFLIATIIKVILGFLAVIFLVLTIVAGFRWMTAGGNEEQVKKAVGTIKNSIIGLVIVLAAYAITYFVFTYLPFSGGGGMPNPQ